MTEEVIKIAENKKKSTEFVEIRMAQVAKPNPNPWLAQEEYSITHFNSAQ